MRRSVPAAPSVGPLVRAMEGARRADGEGTQAADDHRRHRGGGAVVVWVAIGAFTVPAHNMHKRPKRNSTKPWKLIHTALKVKKKNTPELVDKKRRPADFQNGYGGAVEGTPTVELYMVPVPGLRQPAPPVGRRPAEDGRYRPDQSGPAFRGGVLWTVWSTDGIPVARRTRPSGRGMTADPNHLISFLEKVYAEDFQPEEEGSAYKSVKSTTPRSGR